jgi:hypothetical protein
MGHGSCEPSPVARSDYTDLTAELVLLMYLTLADARDLRDRKLLSDEKRIASGIIGCQENKIQDVV